MSTFDRKLRKFGANVRAKRIELGLTQRELGRETGVHPSYISAVERGLRNPRLRTLDRLAKGLGVKASELVEGI
jgi:transcriptional regulator with XRE-family HTH domain